MKGLLCLYLSKLRSLLMRFCSSGVFFSRFTAWRRCAMVRRRLSRIGYGLLAVLVVAYSLLCFSSSDVFAEPALPTGAGHTAVSTATVYEGYNGTTWFPITTRIGEYIVGSGNVVSGFDSRFSGFDLNLGSTVPAGSYSVFTLQINVPTYFSKAEFNGFVSNNSYEVVIVDQQIQERTSQYLIIQFTLYNYLPMQRVSLRSSDGRGLALVFITADTKISMNISDLSWVTVLSGTTLNNSLTDITGSLKSSDSTLKQILNNGITAKVDNSDVISSLQQAQQQAHTDAQNQLNATNQQTEAINQQTEQEKNQYDQEKQEEQDRENQGNEDADKAAGIFNFGVMNPFSGLFALFSPATSCSSVPTIANWLGTDQTTYCSWWPSSVRTVLTPVFGISSIMLLFGFVVRWLGSGYTFDVDSMDLGGKR